MFTSLIKLLPKEGTSRNAKLFRLQCLIKTQQVVTQEAIATRFGVHDKVLSSDIWQEWSKGMIPEYIPAPIAGYDAPVIPAEQVDENASDRNRKDQLHSTTS